VESSRYGKEITNGREQKNFFEEIRKENIIYADKTPFLIKMIEGPAKAWFIRRPGGFYQIFDHFHFKIVIFRYNHVQNFGRVEGFIVV
jgi:hypothetical protein